MNIQLIHSFREFIYWTNISLKTILFQANTKISLISVVKPGIPGKSQKTNVDMFPKKKKRETVPPEFPDMAQI